MMAFCISAGELRKALADIEAAERNGFMHCLSAFELTQAGRMISDNLAAYSDMIERAHPTDGRLDWGRFQRVSARHTFADGKLVPIEPKKRCDPCEAANNLGERREPA